jgi:hypothetical protein
MGKSGQQIPSMEELFWKTNGCHLDKDGEKYVASIGEDLCSWFPITMDSYINRYSKNY